LLFISADGNILMPYSRGRRFVILPNIKSAAKRARQNIKREIRNRRIKSMLKTSIRRFEESLQSGDHEDAKAKLYTAVCQIDKAAAKGILHKNNAARKKSRLSRLYDKTIAV
jgi:small subunit ribosomal protein S20